MATTGVACLDVSDAPGGIAKLLAVGDAFASDLLRSTPASLCVIYLYQETTDDLVAAYAAGINAQLVAGLRIELAQSVSGWVAANLQTSVNSDPALDLRGIWRSAGPALRSCLSMPLLADDTLVGVLSIYSTVTQAFSDEHRRSVDTAGRKLGKLVRDTLADVRPARALEPMTPRLASRSRASSETQSPNSAAILVVEFSDALVADSEKAGAVLEYTASLLQRTTRSGDVVLRYGPNQLLVILPQTDAATARAIAGRIGCDLASTCQGTGSEGTVAFHAQIGLALVPQDGVLLDSVVDAARRRLEAGERAQDDGLSGHVH